MQPLVQQRLFINVVRVRHDLGETALLDCSFQVRVQLLNCLDLLICVLDCDGVFSFAHDVTVVLHYCLQMFSCLGHHKHVLVCSHSFLLQLALD